MAAPPHRERSSAARASVCLALLALPSIAWASDPTGLFVVLVAVPFLGFQALILALAFHAPWFSRLLNYTCLGLLVLMTFWAGNVSAMQDLYVFFLLAWTLCIASFAVVRRRLAPTASPAPAEPEPTAAPWQPATAEQVAAYVERDLEECSYAQATRFAGIRTPLRAVPIRRGDATDSVFVVAEENGIVVYYDDVEEGFNISRLAADGAIATPGNEQWRLQHALVNLDRPTAKPR